MTEVVMILAVMLFMFVGIGSVANRIPKTGRCPDASGKEIEAVITNSNKTAEKAATMHLKGDDGKNYKVKMSSTEAKMWIKGDRVKIILSENSKNYRVLFHEYFKTNEPRMREQAVEKLQKSVRPDFIAARLTGYTKESPEAFRASGADSQTVFAFMTYMKMIDMYTVVGVILAAIFVYWWLTVKPGFMQLVVPLAILIMLYVVLNGAVKTCTNVLKKATKKA